MKAIVMAGGEGTRLRPVTGEHPKPLVPLLGRPMMEHILLLLRENGFTEVCAAVRYRAEEIRQRFGDGSELGISLCYREETQPLGTAGAVKNCANFYGDEDVLVISGDAACDFDLRSLMEAHRRRKAAATLALFRHPEPLQYGLAVQDESGLIRAFVEKPPWERVVTDLVNTGIYVLSPRAMEPVPEDTPFDFAGDLFPLLLGRGEPLLGVDMPGYWCDVGTPSSYYQCCLDALSGKLKLDLPADFRPARTPTPEASPGEHDAELDCPCAGRAELMGRLSRMMLEMDADYSDGLRLEGPGYRLRVSPAAERSLLHVAVDARDAEFASRLALSMGDLIRALEG